MPLLDHSTQSPDGYIDDVWFSYDTTETGGWVDVRWQNWAQESKKGKGVKYGADRTPYISLRSYGAKRTIVLHIPSCPQALFFALAGLQAADTWYDASLPHPVLGTKTFSLQVLSVTTSDDTAYDDEDPVEDVTVVCVSRSA